jgi:predicted phosphodiesterase
MMIRSEMAPLYIIQGNRDYQQDQPESPDMISSFLFRNQNKSIAYLHETGSYSAGHIGFSLVSVKDTLITGDTYGRQLLPFPNRFPLEIKIKIALFHGTIINSSIQNYSKSKDEYPIDWINGHDLCLLGGVHLQQIHNTDQVIGTNIHQWSENTMPWGYSGSLIQQSFEEPLFGHGFLLWDIDNRKVIPYHVKNPYGLVYLKKRGTLAWTGFDQEWKTIDTVITETNFPNNVLFKIKGNYEAEDFLKLCELLKSYNKINDFKVTL